MCNTLVVNILVTSMPSKLRMDDYLHPANTEQLGRLANVQFSLSYQLCFGLPRLLREIFVSLAIKGFVRLPFGAGQLTYRALSLITAVCCIWKRCWWELWERSKAVKLWVISWRTLRWSLELRGTVESDNNYLWVRHHEWPLSHYM